MKLANTTLLEGIFALKGNFGNGLRPAEKVFSGVEVAPFKGNAKAAVSISGDFELSWAWRASGPDAAKARGEAERRNVPFILELLEQHSIPVTWATVGHLFLESCKRSVSGLAHEHMPRPSSFRWDGDWYMQDPCSDFRRDPLWYAPDLVQKILDCKTPQEISTHTFSHFNFSAASPELVKREFEACSEAMAPFGLRPRSLVFPHNVADYAYLPVIAAHGILAARHRDKKIRLAYPERTEEGVYKLCESMNLRAAKHYDYVEKAKLFIQKAIERQAAYSLWFHPSDDEDVFDRQFRGILKHVAERRKTGDLWVTTMVELAAYCEAREQLTLQVERGNNSLSVSPQCALDTGRYGTPDITLVVPLPTRPKIAWRQLADGTRTPIEMPDQPAASFVLNTPFNTRLLYFEF